MSPYSNNLCEQQDVYRRICPAGGHHTQGSPSLRAARAAARAQAARQVSNLPGRRSGVGRLYSPGPAARLQAERACPLAGRPHQSRRVSLAEGGAACGGQAGADRGRGGQAARAAPVPDPVRRAAGAAPLPLWRPRPERAAHTG